jgi:hypothetical protein
MSSKRDHSTRPKSSAVRSRHKRKAKPPGRLPRLDSILHALLNAISLVRAAHMAMRYTDDFGPAEVTLRTGIEALQSVYSDLDGIETQLHHYRERNAKTAGVRS